MDDVELLAILGIAGIVVYLLSQAKGPASNVTAWLQQQFGWPAPGQESTNIGGQKTGTTPSGTQYGINQGAGYGAGGGLWTVFPASGANPIVDIDPMRTPVGPQGQTINQLLASGMTNQQIADMIATHGIVPGGESDSGSTLYGLPYDYNPGNELTIWPQGRGSTPMVFSVSEPILPGGITIAAALNQGWTIQQVADTLNAGD